MTSPGRCLHQVAETLSISSNRTAYGSGTQGSSMRSQSYRLLRSWDHWGFRTCVTFHPCLGHWAYPHGVSSCVLKGMLCYFAPEVY